MPIEMDLWRLDGEHAIPVSASKLETERRLEEVLERDPSLLGLDVLLIVGRQVPTSHGTFIDLLALDSQGNVYVIELKRNRTPREVVAQALDYGSWARGLGYEELTAVWAAYDSTGKDFEAALAERFGESAPSEFNADHRLIIVAAELDGSTERIVNYLADYESRSTSSCSATSRTTESSTWPDPGSRTRPRPRAAPPRGSDHGTGAISISRSASTSTISAAGRTRSGSASSRPAVGSGTREPSTRSSRATGSSFTFRARDMSGSAKSSSPRSPSRISLSR